MKPIARPTLPPAGGGVAGVADPGDRVRPGDPTGVGDPGYILLAGGAVTSGRGGRIRALAGPFSGAAAVLFLVGAGCTTAEGTAKRPVELVRSVNPSPAEKLIVNPVNLQHDLLRFTDEFTTQMVVGVDQLQRDGKAIAPAELLRWKIMLVSEPCAIVSGSNPLAGLLDLTVFVTVMRASLEHHWQPKVFGESARAILESCRYAETAIWGYVGKVLTSEQQVELRRAIVVWQERNPNPESILGARAQGFASRVAKVDSASAGKPGSVFDLLRLDPLSGLDPATREIAETRLFAERALFVFQKTSTLLRWQVELAGLNASEMPAVRQVVANSTQIAESVDRFSRVAEQLPRQLSTEREEILKAFEKQEKTLAPIVSDVRGALTMGTQMSDSLNTTITTFDGLMKRFGVGEAKPDDPSAAKGEPFRIKDYAETAVQLEQMSLRLTELIRTFDQTLGSPNLTQLAAHVTPVVQQAQAGGKEVVDYAFWRGILLVVFALAAALIYRLVSNRLSRPTQSKPDLP